MPRHNFFCSVCGAVFEKTISFHGNGDSVICPKGHAQERRVYSLPSVVFKGSGWYNTDQRRSKKPDQASEAS